jgi:hypothetical protein
MGTAEVAAFLTHLAVDEAVRALSLEPGPIAKLCDSSRHALWPAALTAST